MKERQAAVNYFGLLLKYSAPNEGCWCLTECMYSILFHGYNIITGTAAAHDAP